MRILLVEDSPLFRSALVNALTVGCSERRLVEIWASSRLIALTHPIPDDLILIDTATWTSPAASLIRAIQAVARVTPVLLLGSPAFLDAHPALLSSGIAGFVEQTASPRRLNQAIAVIQNKGVWFDRASFQKLLGPGHPPPARIAVQPMEMEVLKLITEGKTNKEIGSALGYSERTIKGFVTALFRKTGASTRSGLAAFAIRHGLEPVS